MVARSMQSILLHPHPLLAFKMLRATFESPSDIVLLCHSIFPLVLIFYFYFTTCWWLLLAFSGKGWKKWLYFTLSHVAQLEVNTKLDLPLGPSYFMGGVCLFEFQSRASIISFFSFLPPRHIAQRKCEIDAIWKLCLWQQVFWGFPQADSRGQRGAVHGGTQIWKQPRGSEITWGLNVCFSCVFFLLRQHFVVVAFSITLVI